MKLSIPANEDLHEFWFDWIKDGAGGHAPIAKDDAPHPHFRFYVSWSQYRHLGNILLVQFSDLLQDLRGEIERIAKFQQFQLDDAAVDAVTQATTFSSMNRNKERLISNRTHLVNKGTNVRRNR